MVLFIVNVASFTGGQCCFFCSNNVVNAAVEFILASFRL